jgi:uncharacterized repeat protein (TIGR01451 family)
MKNLKSTIVFLFCIMFSVSVFSQWVKLPGPEGGCIFTVNKVGNQVWTGGCDGIYTSSDEGITWHKSGLVNGTVSDIETTNDSTLISYYVDSANGMGISGIMNYSISSIDGGATWTAPVLIENFSNSPVEQIYRSNSVCIIKASTYHISHDFGHTWTDFVQPYGSYITQMCSDGKTLLLQSFDMSPNQVIKDFISTNGAASWQPINYPEPISSFFIKDHLLFLAVHDTVAVPNNYYIVRSANYGATWDTVYTCQTGQMINLFLNSNENILAYISTDYSFDSLLISPDNGLTWTISPWPGTHFYSEVVKFSNGDKIGIGNGGLVRYSSGLNVYVPANNGIASQQIFYLTSNNNVLFASTEMESYRSIDAGQTWQHLSLQDNPAYSMTFKGDSVFCIAGNHIGRSFDNGVTWDTVTPPCAVIGYNFLSSIEINNNILYFSGDSMYYSNNFGQSWINLPKLPNVPVNPCYSNYETAGRFKSFDNELYAVTTDGFVFKYNTTTISWHYLTCFWSTGAGSNNNLNKVDTALLVCGYGFKYTLDHGQTWIEPALHGLNYYPDNIISINGTWFCSEYYDGVHISTDRGENWQDLQSGVAPFKPYRGFTEMNGILYCGSHCSSVWRRAGVFESISGTVYLDANNNGIKESSETVLPGIIVKTNPASMAVCTDTNGVYILLTDMTGDTLRPVKSNPYTQINPPYYLVNGAAINQDFGFYITPGIKDLGVDISNVSAFRPGFLTQLHVTAKNNGSVKQPAQVQITLDSNLVYVSANPLPASVSGNIYTWITDSISFPGTRNISVEVSTNLSAQLGDSVRCSAIVYPVLHDTVPANNYSKIRDIIVGSYDPNDKQCQQGDFISPQQVQNGEEIVYTIRFQNTGTFQADFIHVIDTLSHYFDISTLRIISSSHPMTWTLSEGNAVDFYFQNIFLPPSTADEPNSHGFVKFGIQCKKTLEIGNALANTAYIYFDYNPAIVTNTTATIVVIPIHVGIPEDFTKDESAANITVYPNPTANELTIDMGKLKDSGLKLVICNTSGSIVKEENITDKLHVIRMGDHANGMYYGVIINPANGKKVSFKFILRK